MLVVTGADVSRSEISDDKELPASGAARAPDSQITPIQRSSAAVKPKKRKTASAASKQTPGSGTKRRVIDQPLGNQRSIVSFFTRATTKRGPPDSSMTPSDSARADQPCGDASQDDQKQQHLKGSGGAVQPPQAAGNLGDARADAEVTLVDDEADEMVEVKAEPGQEPAAPAAAKRLMGAYTMASAPSVGVSNALIEKRRAAMRKAAGSEGGNCAPEGGNGRAAVKREAEEAVTWQEGTPAPYLLIARAFAAMESTTKRLAKDNVMVEMFRSILRCSSGWA